MSGPSDSSNGRKRPYERAVAGGGSNKYQSRDLDREHKNKRTTHSFVTGDGRLITDSIPNHVQRLNGEVTLQSNSLKAVLNAQHEIEKQLRQHNDQLAETKQSLQQVEARNDNKKVLGETAGANDQVKKEMADLKRTMQAQLDVINLKTTRQDSMVQQTLSTIGKCLQKIGSMSQQTMEEDQDVERKVAVNDVQTSQQAGNEASDASSTPVKVSADQFFQWLESLDFRRSLDFDRYNNADYQFHEIELLRHEQTKYYLVRQSPQQSTIPSETRSQRTRGPDSIATTDDERRWRNSNILHMTMDHRPADCHSSYVLPLGLVFVDNPNANIPIMWTGFHLVMDIAEPSKPLWLVYCCEGAGHWVGRPSWPSTFPGRLKQKRDIVKFSDGVETAHNNLLLLEATMEDKDEERHRPIFTKPDYRLLRTAIDAGLKEAKGPTRSFTPLGGSSN